MHICIYMTIYWRQWTVRKTSRLRKPHLFDLLSAGNQNFISKYPFRCPFVRRSESVARGSRTNSNALSPHINTSALPVHALMQHTNHYILNIQCSDYILCVRACACLFTARWQNCEKRLLVNHFY